MEAEKNQEAEGTTGNAGGLIIDFDYTFVDGVGLLESVTMKTLASANVTIAPGMFARKLFGKRTVPAINALLGASPRTTPESVVSTIASGMDQAIVDAPVNACVLNILKQSAEADVKTIFVTSRAADVVEQKIEAAGVSDAAVIKVERCDRFGEYAHDAWLRAARAIHVVPRACTVIAATALSIRQAVMAGMHTVAFINPTISFQDFTGADVIVEGPDVSGAAAEVLAFMNRNG